MRHLSYRISRLAVLLALLLAVGNVCDAQRRNDKLLNRPYADARPWHLGFSFGVQSSSLMFTHNGLTTDSGQAWFMEQPSYSPGFCVNGMVDFRLNDWFNIRISPGMYFGTREIRMIDYNSRLSDEPLTASQNIKSTFVVVPFDVKYSGMRFRNLRPYVTGGVMPAFDVGKRRDDYLNLNVTDCYLTVGLGCDFYLPYFKLIPELKFCFGLTDVLKHDRPDLADNPDALKYTQSLTKARSNMVVLTFYFE